MASRWWGWGRTAPEELSPAREASSSRNQSAMEGSPPLPELPSPSLEDDVDVPGDSALEELSAENRKLKMEVEQYKSACGAMQRPPPELEAILERCSELEAQNGELEVHVDQLEALVRAQGFTGGEGELLQARCLAIQEQKEGLELEIDQLRAVCSMLKVSDKEAQQLLMLVQQKCGLMSEEKQEMSLRMEQLQALVRGMESDQAELVDEIEGDREQLWLQVEQLESRCRAVQPEPVQDELLQMCDALQVEREELMLQVEQLQSTCNALQTQGNKESETLRVRCSSLEGEKSELMLQLDQMRALCNSNDAGSKEDIEWEKARNSVLLERNEALALQVEQFQATIRGKEIFLQDIEKVAQQCERLHREEGAKLTLQLEQLQSACRNSSIESEESKAALEKVWSRCEELEEERRGFLLNVDQLQAACKSLEAANSSSPHLAGRSVQLEDQMEASQVKLQAEQFQSMFQFMERDRSGQEAEKAEMQAELERLRQLCQSLEDSSRQSSASYNFLNKRCGALEAEICMKNMEAKQNQEQIQKLVLELRSTSPCSTSSPQIAQTSPATERTVLEAEIGILRAEAQQAKDKCTELELEVANLRSSVTPAKQKSIHLEVDLQTLSRQLNQAQDQHDALLTEYKKLKDQLAGALEERDDLSNRCLRLEAERESLLSEGIPPTVDDLKGEFPAPPVPPTVDDLKADGEDLRKRCETLEAVNIALKTKVDAFESRQSADGTPCKSEPETKDDSGALGEENESLRKQLEALQTRCKSAEDKVDVLTERACQVQDMLTAPLPPTVDDLEADGEAMRKRCETLETVNIALNMKVSSLETRCAGLEEVPQKMLQESDSLKAENNSLLIKLEDWQTRCAALEAERKTLSALMSQLRSKCNALEEAAPARGREVAPRDERALQAASAQAASALEEMTKLREERDELKGVVAKLKDSSSGGALAAENSVLALQVAQLQDKCQQLESSSVRERELFLPQQPTVDSSQVEELQRLRSEREESRKTIAQLQDELDRRALELQADRQEFEEERAMLAKELEDKQAIQVANLQIDSEAKSIAWEAERAELAKQLEELREGGVSRPLKLAGAMASLDQAHKDPGHLEAKNAALTAEVTQLLAKCQALESNALRQREVVLPTIRGLEGPQLEELKELRDERNRLQDTIARLQAENSKLAAQKSTSREAELPGEDLSVKCADLEAENKRMSQQLSDLQTKCDALEEKRAVLLEEYRDLQRQKEELQLHSQSSCEVLEGEKSVLLKQLQDLKLESSAQREVLEAERAHLERELQVQKQVICEASEAEKAEAKRTAEVANEELVGALEGEKAQLERKVEQLALQHRQACDTLEVEKAKHAQDLRQAHEQGAARSEAIEQERAHLAEEVQKLHAQCQSLQSLPREATADRSSTEVDLLQAKISALEEERDELTRHVAELKVPEKAAPETAKATKAQQLAQNPRGVQADRGQDVLVEELINLEAKCGTLESDKKKLAAEVEKLQVICKEKDSFHPPEKVEELQDACTSLTSLVQKLREDLTTKDQEAMRELDDIRGRCSILESEKANLEETLNVRKDKASTVDNLKQTCAELMAKNSEIAHHHQGATAKLADQEAIIDDLRSKCTQLMNSNKSLQEVNGKQKETSEEQLRQQGQELEDAQKRFSQLEEEHQRLSLRHERHVEDSFAQLRQHTVELEEARKRCSQLLSDNEHLALCNDQQEDVGSQLRQQSQELEEMKMKCRQLESEKLDMARQCERQVEDAGTQLRQRGLELEDAKKRCSQAESDYQRLAQEHAAHKEEADNQLRQRGVELEDTRRRFSQVESDHERLTEQHGRHVEDATVQLRQREAELGEAKQQHERQMAEASNNLRQRDAELEEALRRSREVESGHQELEIQHERLVQQVSNVRDDLRQRELELEETRRHLHQLEVDRELMVNQHQRELEDADLQVRQLTEELGEAKQSLEKREKQGTLAENFGNQLRQRDLELEEAKSRCHQAEAELERLRALHQQHAQESGQQLRQMELELEEARRRCSESSQERSPGSVDDSPRKLRQREMELEQAIQRCHDAKRQAVHLQKEVEERTQEVEETKRRYSQVVSDHTQMANQHERQMAEVDHLLRQREAELEEALQMLQEEEAEKQQRAVSHTRQLEELSNELRQREIDLEEARQMCSQMEAERHALQKQQDRRGEDANVQLRQCEAELEEAHQKCHQLESEHVRLAAQHAKEVQDAVHELRQREMDLEDAKGELVRFEQDRARLVAQCQELESANANLQSTYGTEIQEWQDRCAQLESETNRLAVQPGGTENMAEVLAKEAKKEKEIEELRRRCARLEANNQHLINQHAGVKENCESRVKQKDLELEEWKTRCTSVESESARQKAAFLEELETVRSSLDVGNARAANEQLQQRRDAELQELREKCKAYEQLLEPAETQLEELKVHCRSAEAEASRLSQEYMMLAEKSSNMQSEHETQLDAWRSRCALAEAQADRVEDAAEADAARNREMEELRDRCQELEVNSLELDALQARIGALEAENERYSYEVAQVQQQLQSQEALTAQHSSAAARHAATIQQLQLQRESWEAERHNLAAQVVQLSETSRTASLQNDRSEELEKVQRQCSTLQSQNDQLAAQVERLTRDYASLGQEHAQLSSHAEQALKEQEHLQQQHARLSSEVQQHHSQAAQRLQERRVATLQLRELCNRLGVNEQPQAADEDEEWGGLAQLLEKVRAELDRHKVARQAAEREVQQHNQRAGRHAADETSMREQLGRVRSDYAVLEARNKQLAGEVERHRSETSTLEAARKRATVQAEVLQRQAEQQATERGALEAETFRLRAENTALGAENARLRMEAQDAQRSQAALDQLIRGKGEPRPAGLQGLSSDGGSSSGGLPAAERWVLYQAAAPLDATPGRTYFGFAKVDFRELAPAMELPAPPVRQRLASVLASGALARAALQAYRTHDTERKGYLDLQFEVPNLVEAVFRQNGLSTPPRSQIIDLARRFDHLQEMRLDARACVCLVDALIRGALLGQRDEVEGVNSERVGFASGSAVIGRSKAPEEAVDDSSGFHQQQSLSADDWQGRQEALERRLQEAERAAERATARAAAGVPGLVTIETSAEVAEPIVHNLHPDDQRIFLAPTPYLTTTATARMTPGLQMLYMRG